MLLKDKKILIMGIRNKWSIAFGIAKSAYENGAQLIFNTHDVSLLDQDIFRRDQIYFVEKDNKTAMSDLYSLAEFSPRKSEGIRKGYLQGRYGAIPAILPGGFEW